MENEHNVIAINDRRAFLSIQTVEALFFVCASNVERLAQLALALSDARSSIETCKTVDRCKHLAVEVSMFSIWSSREIGRRMLKVRFDFVIVAAYSCM